MNDELEIVEGNAQVLVQMHGGTREYHEKAHSIHG